MAQQASAEKLLTAFPIIESIEEDGLKQAVIDCWLRVWRESGWDNLEDCPFNPAFSDASLVGHVNCVTALVLAAASAIEAHYSEVSFDRDLLVAGALLHDLSKMVEIERKDEHEAQYSQMNQMLPHAVYGAFVAMTHELPMKLINIIMAHSQLTGTRPQSPEAVLLHYIDYGLADVLRSNRGLGLILDLLGGIPPRNLFKLHH